MRGELGHERIVTCGGDLGGVVLQDMALRFPGLVVRQVMFNTVLPVLGEAYEAAGIDVGLSRVTRMAADYFLRQARDADGLAAELTTPEMRRRYVAEMYGPRFWAAPGAFTPRGRGVPRRAVRRRGPVPRVDRELRVSGGHARAIGAAALHGAEPDADARAVRPGGPRDPVHLPARGRGRVPEPDGAVRGARRRAISCSGSGPSC